MRSLAVMLLVAACVAGCAGTEPISTPQQFYRSPAELTRLEKEAAAGRGDSAYEISLYYYCSVGDGRKGDFWLEKAAALHWKPAMESLANSLEESDSVKDRRRARILRAQAAKLPEV